MNMKVINDQTANGFSLIELLTSIAITSAIITGAVAFFADTTHNTQDRATIIKTKLHASHLLELIVSEIRMAGAGVPMQQKNFSAQDSSLKDAPLPVLTNSNEYSITFRITSTGEIITTTEDFQPSNSNLSFSALPTRNLKTGDMIYISNSTTGGQEAMLATINSISKDRIYITKNYFSSEDAYFRKGSICTKTTLVTYQSITPETGIERIENGSIAPLARNATVKFKYLDQNGDSIKLPLNSSTISNALSSISVSVNIKSQHRLRNGNYHNEIMQQAVAIRNIVVAK